MPMMKVARTRSCMYDNDGKAIGSLQTSFVNLGYKVGLQLRKRDDVKNNNLIFWEMLASFASRSRMSFTGKYLQLKHFLGGSS